MKNRKKLTLIQFLLGIAVIIVLSIVLKSFCKISQVNVFNTALIFFFCVAGQYIMLGLGGMLGMCSITFLGLGAFVCAYLNTRIKFPLIPSMLAGTLAAGLLALFLGLLLLKLQGLFFVFGTIGVVYIGTAVFQNFTAFTGGPNGTSGIEKLSLFGYTFSTFKTWIPLLGTLVLLLIFLLYRIKHTSFGRSLMAVRDDETAAFTLGINVYRTKVIAFTVAGLLSGFGGTLYAVHNGTVSASLFTFATQTKFIIMLMLGGVMSPIGALCGTILVNFLPEMARFANSYLNLLYGTLIIVLMIFMPMGLSGLCKELMVQIRKRNRDKKSAGKGVPKDVLS